MRPVSGSVALPRMRSFTVSLMAFSGATPYQSNELLNRVTLAATTHNQLRAKSTVEAEETLIAEDLLRTVDAVFVEDLTDDSAPLVLHTEPLVSTSVDGRYIRLTESDQRRVSVN